MPEDCGQLVLAIENSQDTSADENLPAWKRDGALESRVGVEVKMVGQLAWCVSSNTVADSLQVLLNARGSRAWRKAPYLRKFSGKDLADSGLLGV